MKTLINQLVIYIYVFLRIRLLQSPEIHPLKILSYSLTLMSFQPCFFCEKKKEVMKTIYRTQVVYSDSEGTEKWWTDLNSSLYLLSKRTELYSYTQTTSNMATQSSNIMTIGHMTCETQWGLKLVGIWGLRTCLEPGFFFFFKEKKKKEKNLLEC